MRNLKVIKSARPNSMLGWHRAKNPLIIIMNFIIVSIAKILPSLSAKRALLRLTGMRIEHNVSIGLGAMFDIFFPELITLRENCMIGYNTTILAHEFLQKELRTGPVEICRNALLGANTTVLAGVRVGNDAVVSACSLVNSSIPDGKFYGGVPAKEIRQRGGSA